MNAARRADGIQLAQVVEDRFLWGGGPSFVAAANGQGGDKTSTDEAQHGVRGDQTGQGKSLTGLSAA
ncbi:MAG: hypothetical protein J6386_24720 [Candidatus Synoicihabitans palmerolidicus]|nr:hypothetical protein [Candidatus Synoicihabitans palmerolidicus]